MAKYKSVIRFNLSGMVDISSAYNTFGVSAINSKNNKDIFIKSLKRYHTDVTKISNKLRLLLNKFNSSKNIEVIRKSSVGKKMINFIEEECKDKKALKSIAFIARFKDPIEEYEVNANSIIITTNVVRDKNEDGDQIFYHELTGINIMQIQELNYRHEKVIKLEGIEFEIYEDAISNGNILISKQDLSPISNLRKSLDIWGDGGEIDNLNLKEMLDLTGSLRRFLSTKEKNVLIPYLIDPKIEEKFIKIEDGTKINLYTITENEYKFFGDDKSRNSSNKYIIGSDKDVSSKMRLIINGVKEISISKESDTLMENIYKKIDQNEALVSDMIIQIKNNEDQISKTKDEIASINVKFEENNSNIDNHKKEQQLLEKICENSQLSIDEINLTIKKNNQLLVQLSKKIKGEKKSDLISYNKKTKEIKSKIEESQNKVLKLKKVTKINNVAIKEKNSEISELKNEAEEYNKKLLEMNENFKNKVDNVKKNNTEIKKLKTINSKATKKIALIKSSANKMIEKNKHLYKISALGKYNERDKTLKSSFAIINSTFQNLFLKDNDNDANMSDYDPGFSQIIKRQFFSLIDYQEGSFKSPYAALSLDKPDVDIKLKEVKSKLNLSFNNEQQMALNASNQAHFASFLQGPPGTGKTQVIAAAIDQAVRNGENVVLTSSTNEAIDNAFDRVAKNNSNPNLFMLRYSRNLEHKNKYFEYTEEALYKNFINRINRHVGNQNGFLEIDNNQLNEIISDEIIVKKYVPKNFKELIKNKENNINHLVKICNYYSISYDEEYIYDDLIDHLGKQYKRLKINNESKIDLLDNFILVNHETQPYELSKGLKVYIDNILSKRQETNDGGFANIISKITNEMNNLQEKEFTPRFFKKSKEFAINLFKNELINLIGITTTSRLEIKVYDENPKQLFSDYKVDNAIIDEVSKSVTPEILYISKLANRFMFAGDYRQLPPQFDIDNKILIEFKEYLKNKKESLENEGYQRSSMIEDKSLMSQEEFNNYVNNVYSNSLFTNLVFKMKKNKKLTQASYVSLKEQYRFGKEINKLVNLTYDNDEKLIANRPANSIDKYEMGIKSKTDFPICIIDTTYITEDIANEFAKYKVQIEPGDYSFDQKYSFLANRDYNSLVNDYNVKVILKIINNLFENNNKLKGEDIGVIAMTRSQANLIKLLLKNNEKNILNNIKIDTVDNFQGREKKIIILDLVRAAGKLEKKGDKIKYLKSRNVDYYKKPERINVAASRAQNKLIIVGSIDGYLDQKVISEIVTESVIKRIKLFQKWKEICNLEGEIKTWEEF